jgi:hypothetical protein
MGSFVIIASLPGVFAGPRFFNAAPQADFVMPRLSA